MEETVLKKTRELLEKAGITGEVISGNDSFEYYQKLEEQGYVLVFSNVDEAKIASAFLLSRPEYQWVSHFKLEENISRGFFFVTLTPVPADSGKKFVFLPQQIGQSFYKEVLMGEIRNEMRQEIEKQKELERIQREENEKLQQIPTPSIQSEISDTEPPEVVSEDSPID